MGKGVWEAMGERKTLRKDFLRLKRIGGINGKDP